MRFQIFKKALLIQHILQSKVVKKKEEQMLNGLLTKRVYLR